MGDEWNLFLWSFSDEYILGGFIDYVSISNLENIIVRVFYV